MKLKALAKKLKLLYERFDSYESISNTDPKELKKALSISLDIAKDIIFIASGMRKKIVLNYN